MANRRLLVTVACLLVLFSLVSMIILLPMEHRTQHQGPTPTAAELEKKYAPILHFDREEELFPMEVGQYIGQCRLMHWQSGLGVMVEENITDATLEQLGSTATDYYLDNKQGSIADDGISKWYQAEEGSLGRTLYCRLVSSGERHLVQYWMFYAFNNGTFNRHEGDWEMFQVLLNAEFEPTAVMFSQHQTGLRTAWDSVTRGDANAVEVYVAKGSHGTSCLPETINATAAGSEAKVLGPSDYLLVELSDPGDGDPAPPWLAFAGRWGEWGGSFGDLLGTRGPQGPVFRSGGALWEGFEWGLSLPLWMPPASAIVKDVAPEISMRGHIQAYTGNTICGRIGRGEAL